MMSSPGRSRPGTPGVCFSSANALRIAYCWLTGTTTTTGSAQPRGRPERLHRVVERAVADHRHHRPAAPGVPLGQRDADRRRQAVAEAAAGHREVRRGAGDPQLAAQRGQVGR